MALKELRSVKHLCNSIPQLSSSNMDKRRTQFMETFWQHHIRSGFPLWICLLLSIQILSTGVHTCVFPDYVQSTVNGIDNARDWKGEIRDQNREVTLQ